VLILLTPIGALAPGTAWGEWSTEELDSLVGYVPVNLEKVGGWWRAAMPDYATPGVSNELLGYLVAAVVGAGVVVAVALTTGVVLARRHGGGDSEAGSQSPPVTPSAS
jgi:hypothetical protein